MTIIIVKTIFWELGVHYPRAKEAAIQSRYLSDTCQSPNS